MKSISIVLVLITLFTAGCATRQSAQYHEQAPENNFKGIVDLQPSQPLQFMNQLQLAPPTASDVSQPDPALYNYSWFYTRGQTFGQHLDAWAHRFAFRFESRIPLGYDPYVQSDGSFIGNFNAAIEDLGSFSAEGRAQFVQYHEAKRLRTRTLQITVYEKERYLLVEQRNMQLEAAEAEREQKERLEADRTARWVAFFDYFRSSK